MDGVGDLFVADRYWGLVRRVTALGVVSTLAGGGAYGVDGTGATAGFYYPEGVAVDRFGSIYVADRADRTIRKVTPAGVVTTIGGMVGVIGGADGIGRAATFADPAGIAVDSAGSLYVADNLNNRISKGTLVYPPIVVRFQAPTYAVAESAGSATITVVLSAAAPETVTVQYASGGGSATAGRDYSAVSGALTLAPGETTKTFAVPLAADGLPEMDETVVLTLSSPTYAVLGAPVTTTLTIGDSDTQFGGIGVAAWWRFDENAGLSAADAGPGLLTATLSEAGLWSADGAEGGCLALGTAWVTTPPDAEALTTAAGIGLSAWVCPSADDLLLSNLFPVAVKGTTQVAYGLYLEGDLGGEAELGLRVLFQANVANGGTPIAATSTVAVPFGEWSYVAAIYDRTAVWFFVDGVFAGRTLASAPITNNAEVMVVGADLFEGALYRGLLDEVAVFAGAVPPITTAVGASSPDGFYKAGTTLAVTLTFSQPVTVTGTPQLTLATGGAGTSVACIGGSGTQTLTFAYTVASGHTSPDLDVTGSGALALNGGTLRNAQGRDAILVLPVPGTADSLSASHALVVDTTAPTVVALDPPDNATGVGPSANLVLDFGEPVEKGTAGNLIIRRADNVVFETIPITDARVTVSGSRVAVNPTGTLTGGTSYYVLVGATCLRDRAGNAYAGIGTATTWNFATSALPSVQFAAATSTASESGGTASVAVNLSAAWGETVTVQYDITPGSALAGMDYTVASGTLSVAPGETARTVAVALLTDTLDEADETLTVTLSAPTQAVLGSPSAHVLTILDDDPPPSVAFAAATSVAGETVVTVAVTVRLSAASSFDVTVPYTLAGSATPVADYSAPAGPLVIPAGQVSGTLTVTLVDDGLEEQPETVVITLATPTHATLGTPVVHTLTITANDDDHDGLPDAWEVLHFGGHVDPLGDPDADGFNTLCEYLDGTDPLDKASFGTGRNVDPASGHAYRFYSGTLSWDQAQEDCEFLGAHLATVSGDAENGMVYGQVAAGASYAWIGGSMDRLGNWRWVTAETWTFSKWRSGEPSAVSGRDYAGMVGPAGSVVNQRKWAALILAEPLVAGHVCEWDYAGDVDADGLPDAWEMRYFLSLLPLPGDDPDGDTLTNLQEQALDSNPTQRDPVYAVRATGVGGTVTGTGNHLAGRPVHLTATPDSSPYTLAVDQWLQVLPDEQTAVLQTGGYAYDTAPLTADLEVRVTFRCVGGAPTPNPLAWEVSPQATAGSWTAISMTAALASHPLGVDYRFDLVGPGSAQSSGWVPTRQYEFTGLTPDTLYTVEARARNRSGDQVATQPTAQVQARTGPPPASSLEILEPDGVADFPDKDRDFTLWWRAACELAGATVTFYLDNDNSGFPTANPIPPTAIAVAPADSGQMRSTTFSALVYPQGQYYIWGLLNDGYHAPVRVYSPGPFLITQQAVSEVRCELLDPAIQSYGHAVHLRATLQPAVAGPVVFVFRQVDAAGVPLGVPVETSPVLSSALTGVAEGGWAPTGTGFWEAYAYWPGNAQFSPARSPAVRFTITQATAALELVIPRTTLALGTRQVGGLLGIADANAGVSLAGELVSLEVGDPAGGQQTLVAACTEAGQFSVVAGFSAPGVWRVRATFAGTQNLAAAGPTEWVLIRVVQETTYLILCQGSFPAHLPEGLDAHAQTLATIYAKSRGVGLDAEDIQYLTHWDALKAPERDGTPSKAALSAAITEWASARMNAAPAPLYLVLVNHGSVGAFHLGSEVLTPTDLRGLLDTLQNALLTDPVARQQKVVVVLGACHSGSFVRALSGPNRIVIASADTWESSYRGASLAGEESADGEYFVSCLFHELTRTDNSLFAAFQVAAPATRERATCTTPVEPASGTTAWIQDRLKFQHRVDYVVDQGDDTYTYRLTSAALGSQGGVPKPLSHIAFQLIEGARLVGQPSSRYGHSWSVGQDPETGLNGLAFAAGAYRLGAQPGADEEEWFQFTTDRLLDRVTVGVAADTAADTVALPVPAPVYDADTAALGGYASHVTVADNSQQHPLLEDNGDGLGSHSLNGNSGDGLEAQRVYFGTQRNAVGDLSLVRARESLCLGVADPAPELWSEFNRPAGVIAAAWVELKPPGFGGASSGGTMQYSMNLAPLYATHLATDAGTLLGRATWTPGAGGSGYDTPMLAAPGHYQVLYYGQLAGSSSPVSGRSGWVFRASGAAVPAPFSLLTPTDGETLRVPAAFTWEPTVSAGGQVQYLFRLWTDSQATTLHYEAPLSGVPFAVVDQDVLPNGEYWWEVIAVDGQGNARRSELRQVIANTPNSGTLSLLVVKVYDQVTGQPAPEATLTIGGSTPITLTHGACARSLALGTYALVVDGGPQYAGETREVTLDGGVCSQDFALRSVAAQVTLSLERGWNLLALPVQPYDHAIDAVLKGAAKGPRPYRAAYGWDGTGFYPAAALDALTGYWVYCHEACRIEVTGQVLRAPQRSLAAGWSLVGTSHYWPWGSARAGAGACLGWSGGAYRSLGAQAEPETDLMVPGAGYWIHLDQPTAVQLGP